MSNRKRVHEVQLPNWTEESDVLICLRQARAIISKRRNWCQRTYHKRRMFFIHAYCSIGALNLVTLNQKRFYAARNVLLPVMDGSIMGFNDTHTHKEVLAAFDKAITIEEKKCV